MDRSNQLLEYYRNTDYWIDGFEKPINIGQKAEEIDALLKKQNLTQWAYITAYNPLSIALDFEINELRNNNLFNDLKEYTIFTGEGRDKKKLWDPEKSYLVIGIELEKAKLIAQKYGQKAIVYGEIDQDAQIIETLSSIGNTDLISSLPQYCLEKKDFLQPMTPQTIASESLGEHPLILKYGSKDERDLVSRMLIKGQKLILVINRKDKKKLSKIFEEHVSNNLLCMIYSL